MSQPNPPSPPSDPPLPPPFCRPLWTRTLTHDATPFLQYRLHTAHTSHLFLYFIFCMYPPPPLLNLYVTPCTS